MKFNISAIFFLAFATLLFTSCDDDEPTANSVTAPASYSFERNGSSSVSYSGQTDRIKMGNELADELKNPSTTEAKLLEMFRNAGPSGEDVSPFDDADLNSSSKSIKSKTAASADFFSANATDAASIRADFESWIDIQANDVLPNNATVASPGVAGQLAEDNTERYVASNGLEYDQAVVKGLIGGLMTDQMLNNYLSPAVLDAGTNREDNDAGVLVSGQNYTNMEHKWDEAFGYLYGTSADISSAVLATDGSDEFLNKYMARFDGDIDFEGVAEEVYDAFKLGRAAIVEGNYTVRDAQAQIIREKISEMIGVRAVYYLEIAKTTLPTNRDATSLYGAGLHDLSEGYGFIYSLQFTRKPNSDEPYFTKAEVEAMLTDLMDDGTNGLWDVENATLTSIASQIAARFNFTVEEAL